MMMITKTITTKIIKMITIIIILIKLMIIIITFIKMMIIMIITIILTMIMIVTTMISIASIMIIKVIFSSKIQAMVSSSRLNSLVVKVLWSHLCKRKTKTYWISRVSRLNVHCISLLNIKSQWF